MTTMHCFRTHSQDDPLEDIDSVDTALRIERLKSVESSPRETDSSTECPSESSENPDNFCPRDMRKLCKLKRFVAIQKNRVYRAGEAVVLTRYFCYAGS